MTFRTPRPVRRFLALFSWHTRDAEMHEEMTAHLEALTRDLMRAGMSAAEADAQARRRFGNLRRLKEAGHDERRAPLVEELGRDIRHTLRGLRRSPAFTFAVVLTLGIGIGGNTAVFSVVDQVLLRPLPYPDGDRLLMLNERFEDAGTNRMAARALNVVSPANWLDWQRDNHTLANIAVWNTAPMTLTGGGEPVRLNAQMVSAEFFPLLGVQPLLGRTIGAADDRPNVPRVAVISYRLWQQRFGGDPRIIGRTIALNDRQVPIVGVMPEQFRFIYPDNDLWGPLQLDRYRPWRQTSGRFLSAVARLKPGATLAQARADLDAIAARLATTYEFNRRTGVAVTPLREELTGQVHTSLLVLYGAVAVLLAIACFNVANLLLVRTTARSREIALRTSLGASRVSIVRQLLVESVILALAGGVLGIAIAHWSLAALVAFAPPELLRVPELTVDTRVLLYAFGISLATGIIVGVAPAAIVATRPIAPSLRAGGSTVTHAPRMRQALVVCQVAMTVVLLCGAGLLVRTLVALNVADSGFDKHDLLTMEVALPPIRYDASRRALFYRQALEQLRALPGVEMAAASNSLAVIGSPRGGSWFHRSGTPELPLEQRPAATIRVVTPGYFEALRIPVRKGREFTPADEANPQAGFLVNEAFVRAFLSGVDPLTSRITVWMQETNPYLPIIGVVGDVNEGSVRDAAQPTIFYSHTLMPEARMTIVLRTSRPAAMTTPAIAAIRRLDPNLPVTSVQTFEHAMAENLARERLNAMMSVGFAVGGLLLAALGLYGLLAYIVAERAKEIAIRLALGARVSRLTGSIVVRGLALVGAGAGVGLAGAVVLLRMLRTLLFDVTPYDLPTYAAVVLLLILVAVLASFLPARQAARVEPLALLRQE